MKDVKRLKLMYSILTNVDLKAICKNCGFSSDELSFFEVFDTVKIN